MRKMLILGILALLLAIQVSAREAGCIRLRLSYADRPISGGQVTLYRVGAEDTGETPQIFWQRAQEEHLPGLEATTDKEGLAVFADLEPGVYLLAQTAPAVGMQAFLPFFVEIPMKTGESTHWTLEVKPKMAPEESPKTGDALVCLWQSPGLIVACGVPRKKRK